MNTLVTRAGGKSVVIGNDQPLILIGEKINPTGKKELSEELLNGDFSTVRKYAIAQAEAGADILDVNVGIAGIDEVQALSQAVKIVMDVVDLPLALDSANPQAIQAALEIYQGRAIVNSVTGEEKSLDSLLPIVKKYNAAVIALTYDEAGPSDDPQVRLKVAQKIIRSAESMGITPENVIIDCLVQPTGMGKNAAKITLETVRLVRQQLEVNIVLGIANVSFGLPDRKYLNATFLAMAAAQGLTCAIADPTVPEIRKTLLAANVLLGHDEFATKWIECYRSGC